MAEAMNGKNRAVIIFISDIMKIFIDLLKWFMLQEVFYE
jgi:hypothetical protein